MDTWVKICCKGSMYAPIRKAVREARGVSNILLTQILDQDKEVYLKIPIAEAGAWVTLLDSMADEAAESGDENAVAYDDIAEVIAEESEKILGHQKKQEKRERESRESLPRHKNFWKGI